MHTSSGTRDGVSGSTILLLAAFILTLVPGIAANAAHASSSALQRSVNFHIAPQPLPSGLLQFSDQSGVQVVSRASTVNSRYTHGVHGRQSVREGLSRLLDQTGLSYIANENDTVSIVEATAIGASDPQVPSPQSIGDSNASIKADPKQSNSNPSPNNDPQVTEATTQLKSISVTGTRIKQTTVQTAQPITVITANQIQQDGLVTVTQVLENVAQAGRPTVPEAQVDDSTLGGDSTSADLRYFGSERVLLLVNGKRWPTRNLNTIPVAMIDHIEILQDGASAIYGSDAITGVINVILKKNFNGADATAYMGMYHNNYGGMTGWDGKTQNYSFTIGNQGIKGGIVVNAEYQENDEVLAANRVQSAKDWYPTASTLSSNEPGFYQIESPQLANTKIGQATCSASGVCDLGLVSFPENNPTLSNFSAERTDNYNENPWMPFLQPQETDSVFFHTHYDIASNVTFTALTSYDRQNTGDNISPGRWLYGVTGAYKSNGEAGIGIGANNPYNPFGVDLVGNLSQYCPDGHTLGGVPVASCTPNYLLNSYSRYSVEYGPRVFNHRVTNFTYRMGFNGFFDALGSEWDWETGYSYGAYDNEGIFPFGLTNNSLVATQFDSPGAQQCNGPAQAAPGATGTWTEINGKYYQILTPGCVPLNPFGGYNAETDQGSITPAMIAFSQVPIFNDATSTIRDYTGDITGSLAQLPAGPLQVDVGGESLEENDTFQSDAIDINKNSDHNSSNPYGGRIWTKAEYFEFNIPLLANVPLAKSLTLDVANRWSQFTWANEEPETPNVGVNTGAHASTGRAQMRWQVSNDLLLRGSWSQGFRAPTVENLFVAQQANSSSIEDPCAPSTGNGSWNPSTPLPAGCHGLVHSQPSNRIPELTGGNPNLKPESAITHSAGFVYSPDWLPGFNMSVDYYNIDLNNVIGTQGSGLIVDGCYEANEPLFCSRIKTVGNTITLISETPQNLGEEYSNGLDLAADYVLPPTSIGNFRLSTNWTYVRSFVLVTADPSSPTGFHSVDVVGYSAAGEGIGIPKLKANLTAHWTMGNWSANWRVSYIGKLWDQCTSQTIALNWCSNPTHFDAVTDTTGTNLMGTTIYHDVSLTYHVDPINTSVTFGIQNLFNKQFPVCLSCGGGGGNNFLAGLGYRIPGRFFYGRVNVKF